MTWDQFLSALEKTPRDWYISSAQMMGPFGTLPMGRIRRMKDGCGVQCPISSLRDEWIDNYRWVARAVGIDDDLRHRILNAADSNYPGPDREALEQACGLGTSGA